MMLSLYDVEEQIVEQPCLIGGGELKNGVAKHGGSHDEDDKRWRFPIDDESHSPAPALPRRTVPSSADFPCGVIGNAGAADVSRA